MKTMNDVKVENLNEFPYVVTKGNSTVKIYRVKATKNKDGWCYQVCDLTGPKRKLISFADFGKAKAEAERIAKKVRAGDIVALEMGGSERASYGRAIELLKPTQIPLELAVAHYAEAFRILGSDKLIDAAKFFVARHPASAGSKTVPELVKEMVEVKRARSHAPRYVEDLESRLGRFVKAFPGKLVDIDTQAVQKWLDKLKTGSNEPLSNQSLNNYRTVIHSLFSFGERRGYIARGTNPVEHVERAKSKPGATQIFSPEEFSKLLHAASEEYLPALALGGFAGLRSAEIQRLE